MECYVAYLLVTANSGAQHTAQTAISYPGVDKILIPELLIDTHLQYKHALAEFLDVTKVFGDIVSPVDQYLFICFTNRCGSDLLSQAIASTDRSPESEEPFNVDTARERCRSHDVKTFENYFTFTARLLGKYGWFCSKLAIGQLVFLNEIGILDKIAQRTAFVLLERNDILGQAISRRIAWQTGRWTSQQESMIPEAALVYDRSSIDNDMAAISRQNASFRLFFSANSIVPVHLSYEGLITDLDTSVNQIGQQVGLAPLVPQPSRIVVKKLDGHINDQWRRHYLAGV